MNPEDSAQSGTDDIFSSDMEFIERIDKATKKHNNSILEKYGLNTLNDLLTRHSLPSKYSALPLYLNLCHTFLQKNPHNLSIAKYLMMYVKHL